jgi:hypothetical protein
VFKKKFIRSDIYERGTILYSCDVRGITCEAILANKETKAFRHRRFTSDEIRSALQSLSNLNILKPMGSAVDPTFIIDKSLFLLMSELNRYNLFDRFEAVTRKAWFILRHIHF